MSKTIDGLGTAIKNARASMKITQEELAEKLGISARYVMQLENGYKKPSYKLLFKIVHELNIQPELIFYPEKPTKDSKVEDLVRMLHNCDERSMKVIRATVKALWESQSEE